jgi:hypothetical protein
MLDYEKKKRVEEKRKLEFDAKKIAIEEKK